jgi:hypothetical protein
MILGTHSGRFGQRNFPLASAATLRKVSDIHHLKLLDPYQSLHNPSKHLLLLPEFSSTRFLYILSTHPSSQILYREVPRELKPSISSLTQEVLSQSPHIRKILLPPETIHTVSGTASILGEGVVHWDIISEEGNLVQIKVHCKHVPAASTRLLSPQDYCQYHQLDRFQDQYGGNSDYFWLNVNCKRQQF